MARNDYYTIYERDDHFLCQKVDPDDHTPLSSVQDGTSTLPAYKISKTGTKLSSCECWAGQKWCRHKKMVTIFNQHQRINSRWLYNFDKDKWLPPLQQEL